MANLFTLIRNHLRKRRVEKTRATFAQLDAALQRQLLANSYAAGRKTAADTVARNGVAQAKTIVMNAYDRYIGEHIDPIDMAFYKGLTDFINSNERPTP